MVSDPEGTPPTSDGCLPLAKTPGYCKGGGEMVTYENLFALVIIETITLVVLIFKNNE